MSFRFVLKGGTIAMAVSVFFVGTVELPLSTAAALCWPGRPR